MGLFSIDKNSGWNTPRRGGMGNIPLTCHWVVIPLSVISFLCII